MKPESIVIAGYYGFGNAGDELILYSLIQRLRQKNPAVEITVFSQRPSDTSRFFRVQSVNRWRPWTWVSCLMDASHFMLGGGGLLQESTGPWNHLYYLSLLIVAKLFGCRTEVVALGVDPITRPANRFWTRFTLNQGVDALSVRDAVSRQALLGAGVLFPISLRPDPVFDLTMEPPVQAPRGIALALTPSKNHAGESRQIASLCERLSEQLKVPIDLLVFFPQEDEAFAQAIAHEGSAIRHVRVSKNPIELLSWIPHYQLMVATRFHALVLAARSHVPFIGWGGQQKVSSLCQEREMPYINTERAWDPEEQFRLLVSVYQSRNKSVILETRTA